MTLRDVLRKNFADNNSQSRLQGNLLFYIQPLSDGNFETSNFWFEGIKTGMEDYADDATTIETAEDLILLSGGEWTFPLDDEVKLIDKNSTIYFLETKTEMKISKIEHVKLS